MVRWNTQAFRGVLAFLTQKVREAFISFLARKDKGLKGIRTLIPLTSGNSSARSSSRQTFHLFLRCACDDTSKRKIIVENCGLQIAGRSWGAGNGTGGVGTLHEQVQTSEAQ